MKAEETQARAAQITVRQAPGDFQGDPKTYRWSVSEFGLHPDECVGMPFGVGKRTIASALLEAINAAKNLGYSAARVSYLHSSHGIKELDTQLSDEPLTIEKARELADLLVQS